MRWELLILMGLLAAVNAAGQAQYCSVVELRATGRVQLDIPGGGERYGSMRASYRTTGSPTGVSITIEGGNELASVQTPFTEFTLTSTTGDKGTAAGGWRNWFVNVATLSGGTAPSIILRYCLHQSAFSIARFATAPTFSSMTSGSVLFAGPSGLLSQDNTNFIWDDANNVLRLGTGVGDNNTAKLTTRAANTAGVDTVVGIRLDRVFGDVGDIESIDFGDGGVSGIARIGVIASAVGEGALTFSAQTASGNGLTNEVARIRGTGLSTFNFIGTTTNCADGTASPADCTAAPAGSVIVSAGATTVTVNTTAVTANSQIFIQEDATLGTRLSVTCNTTTGRNYTVTTRTAGTSFVITSAPGPTTNPACLSYFIVN